MKICFFTTGVFPVSNDNVKAIENWTYHLASALQAKGNEVVVFGAEGSSKEFVVIEPENSMTAEMAVNNPKLYKDYLEKYFNQCLEYAEKNQVDIIHDQTSVVEVLTNVKNSKIPVVTTFHLIRNEPKFRDLYASLESLHNISPSKYLAQASTPLKFDKIIPHGVDLGLFKFNSNPEDHFLFVGKIIETKGPLLAVAAAKKLEVKLTVCGGPMVGEENESYFQRFLTEIENSPNIKYLGKVNRETVAKEMALAKGFLMPITAPEAFGLVMIEALSCGTPVIVSDLGTAREIVEDKQTGFVVPAGDINEIVNAVSRIEQIDRTKCRQIAESKFSYDKMVENYQQYFLELEAQNGSN